MLTSGGGPARILKLVLDAEITAFYSLEIMAEYENVLFRPQFALDPGRVFAVLDFIREAGVLAAPKRSGIPMTDESDRIFYDVAKNNGALLITGNMKHYPKEPFIVTAAEFLNRP
jgi:predicted nucleic acid-binding protein